MLGAEGTGLPNDFAEEIENNLRLEIENLPDEAEIPEEEEQVDEEEDLEEDEDDSPPPPPPKRGRGRGRVEAPRKQKPRAKVVVDRRRRQENQPLTEREKLSRATAAATLKKFHIYGEGVVQRMRDHLTIHVNAGYLTAAQVKDAYFDLFPRMMDQLMNMDAAQPKYLNIAGKNQF
jgi:outer membrane biosynthesis protein TonB